MHLGLAIDIALSSVSFLTGCTANCKSCQTNGAGKCDSGQCFTGYYFDVGKTSTCLRKLLLSFKT